MTASVSEHSSTNEATFTAEASSVPPSVPLDKSGSRVREMFRQIAPHYDRMNHLLSLSIDRYWRWRTVRMLHWVDDLPVLDTCTGTGDLAIAIAKVSPETVKVIGIDFCHAMLEIARSKQAKIDGRAKGNPNLHSVGKTEFMEADSQALPFSDNRFQCVTVAFGLRNVTDTDLGLREMVRVCSPGGQVVVLEFSRPKMIGLSSLYGFYFQSVLPRIGQWLARNDEAAYRYLPESVSQFPDGEALAERMRAAGLTQVRLIPLTFGIATVYLGTKPVADRVNTQDVKSAVGNRENGDDP